MTRNRIAYIFLSLAVSAVLAGVLLSQVKAQDFGRIFSRIYVPALLVYTAVSLISTWLRAWRYKCLLAPRPISWRNLFLVTFIRNSFDDLLPARIGSLSYIYVLNKRMGFSFESAASSFVVAFVLDFLTLGPFLIAALLAAGLSGEVLSAGTLLAVAAVFFAVFLLILWKIVPLARAAAAGFRAVLKILKREDKPKAQAALEKVGTTIRALDDIRKRRIYGRLFLLSLAIRLGKYLSLFALFYALLRSQGFVLADLSFETVILAITGAEMTSALPVKGLADFGTWESAWVVALRLMHFDPRLAVLTGFGIHLITNLFEYSLGLVSLLILLVPYFWKKRRSNPGI